MWVLHLCESGKSRGKLPYVCFYGAHDALLGLALGRDWYSYIIFVVHAIFLIQYSILLYSMTWTYANAPMTRHFYFRDHLNYLTQLSMTNNNAGKYIPKYCVDISLLLQYPPQSATSVG